MNSSRTAFVLRARHSHFRALTLLAAVMAASLLLLLLVPASPARAAGLVVSNLNDNGPGSLRQAIIDAESNTEADYNLPIRA